MNKFKYSILSIILLLFTGCASQLDIRQGDCSITMVEVDAKASTPFIGGVDADGWVLVQRGKCSPELVQLYKEALGLTGAGAKPGIIR